MIPFAPENEPDVISLTAQLGEACDRLGMPYVAEAEFPNAYYDSGDDYATEWGLPYLKRSARLCAELGADIVKSNWPGSGEQFAEIVEAVAVPVVVAGGSREGDLDLLRKVAEARARGRGRLLGRAKHLSARRSGGDHRRPLPGGPGHGLPRGGAGGAPAEGGCGGVSGRRDRLSLTSRAR